MGPRCRSRPPPAPPRRGTRKKRERVDSTGQNSYYGRVAFSASIVFFLSRRGNPNSMAHVIGEGCLGEVYAACVDVCPVECIHPGDCKNEKFMIIDPEVCIDCGVCLPECPIGPIVRSVA